MFDFTGAPLPDNEEERHQALCGLEVLDSETKPDERFDDITKLVSHPALQVLSRCRDHWGGCMGDMPVTAEQLLSQRAQQKRSTASAHTPPASSHCFIAILLVSVLRMPHTGKPSSPLVCAAAISSPVNALHLVLLCLVSMGNCKLPSPVHIAILLSDLPNAHCHLPLMSSLARAYWEMERT